jgi:putative transposase
MPSYRRDYGGRVWFFTVVTRLGKPIFTDARARLCLARAIVECRRRFPIRVDAWVVMPDHLHAVWTLPDADRDYSRRWSMIKRRFTQQYREAGGHGPPYWQERFWAHRIDDDDDYRHHVDYVHINPMKHGMVHQVADWPWSTFHRYVGAGMYPSDWGGRIALPAHIGNE